MKHQAAEWVTVERLGPSHKAPNNLPGLNAFTVWPVLTKLIKLAWCIDNHEAPEQLLLIAEVWQLGILQTSKNILPAVGKECQTQKSFVICMVQRVVYNDLAFGSERAC